MVIFNSYVKLPEGAIAMIYFDSKAMLSTQVISGLRNKSAVGVDAKQTQRPKALHGPLPTE